MIGTKSSQRLIKYNIFYIIAIFFYIFQPPIFSFNSMHIIGLLSLAIFMLRGISDGKIIIHKDIRPVLVIMSVIFVYLLFFTVGINGANIYAILGPIRFILEVVPFGVLLSNYLINKGLETTDFINMCLIAGGIQVFLGIIAFLVPSVHLLFADLLYARGYGEVVFSLVRNRIFGLADGLMYATPILLSFFGILFIYRDDHRLFNIIVGALFTVTGIVNARISIVVTLMGIIILILARGKSKKQKLIFIGAIVLALLIVVNVLLPIVAERYPFTYQWITSGLEELRLFSRGNRTGYFNYFSDASHFALPYTVLQMLFGVGERPMTGLVSFGNSIQSDIGFINDIWFGGIVYVLLLYGVTYYMLIKLFRSKSDILHFVALFFMVLLPVVNIKGIAFTTNQFTLFIYLLFIVNARDEARINRSQ